MPALNDPVPTCTGPEEANSVIHTEENHPIIVEPTLVHPFVSVN